MNPPFLPKVKSIKMIGFDFDGVFTDGKVLFGEDGKESVLCNRRDSLGINFLQKHGVYTCVVSTETHPVVSARCKKMEIDCHQSVKEYGGGKNSGAYSERKRIFTKGNSIYGR